LAYKRVHPAVKFPRIVISNITTLFFNAFQFFCRF
jgi:hypothetical protein